MGTCNDENEFPRVGANGLMAIPEKARERIELAVAQYRRDLEHAYRMAWYDGAIASSERRTKLA